MKKMTISKGTAACIVMLTVFISGTGVSFARGHGGQHQGMGQGMNQGQGMHGNCTSERYSNRAEMMKSKLNLSDEQQALQAEMHEANMEVRNRKHQDGSTSGHMNNREQKRAMHMFRAELASENPDFQAAADKIKNEYRGADKAEFDAAVDARARFMESLSPEQRDTMMHMSHGRHGGTYKGSGGRTN